MMMDKSVGEAERVFERKKDTQIKKATWGNNKPWRKWKRNWWRTS